MNESWSRSYLASPDIQLGQLSVWLLGWEFTNANNDDDSKWLQIHIEFQGDSSRFKRSGPLLLTTELNALYAAFVKLRDGESWSFEFETLEPCLTMKVCKLDDLGHFELNLEITNFDNPEAHESLVVKKVIDKSYFPNVIRQLRKATEQWPLR